MTLKLTSADSGKTFDGLTLSELSYTGPMVNSANSARLKNILWRSCHLLGNLVALVGFELFQEEDCRYESTVVEGIGKEHGWYPHNTRKNLTLVDCTARNCGGNAFQIVCRGNEAADPDGHLDVGTHSLQGFTADNCGLPRGVGRASYAVSFFGYQPTDGQSPELRWDCPAEMLECTVMRTRTAQDVAANFLLKGAVLCLNRPSFRMNGCVITYFGPADRALVYVRDTDKVMIGNSVFVGSKTIDIENAQEVTISRCTGDVVVRIDGIKMGKVSQGIHWTAPVGFMAKAVHGARKLLAKVGLQ